MANNIKDIAPAYEYGSNRTTKDQIKSDAGVTATGIGLQMLQTTSVRVVNARTYPSRLPSSDPAAFKIGPQGEITMSTELFPAENYGPAPYGSYGEIETGTVGDFETVTIQGKKDPVTHVRQADPRTYYYLTSDTKVQDPLNKDIAPAGISTPPTGTMGFFPVNKIPLGWIKLGPGNAYIYQRAYGYYHTATGTNILPGDALIAGDPANCIPTFANTEYTKIFSILESWDLIADLRDSMYERTFETKNPFDGYFIRTANPTFEGIAQNTHPFETEGQYMSNHSHDGYTYPNYASPINTYHASSKLPLKDNYLIDDLTGSRGPIYNDLDWTGTNVWKTTASANTAPFANLSTPGIGNLGHDIRLYSYRKTNGSVLVYDSEEELNGKPTDMNPITWDDGRQNGLPTILNWNENIDLTIDIKEQFRYVTGSGLGGKFVPLRSHGDTNNYSHKYDYIALEYVHPTMLAQYDYFGKLEPITNEQIQYELQFEKCTDAPYAGVGPNTFTLKFWDWKGTRFRLATHGTIMGAFMNSGVPFQKQWKHDPIWNPNVKICDLNIYDIYRYSMLHGFWPSGTGGWGTYLPSKLKIWIRPNVNGVQFTNTHDLSLTYKDLTHGTHDPALKHDYLKKVLPAGIYHIANKTKCRLDTGLRITPANRKWNKSIRQYEPSEAIHTIEVRALDNSLNLDKGRTSYHVERVNRWDNNDLQYYNRRGFYEPHANNLVYANADFGTANTNQRIGTSYMFNYRYTFGSEWGTEGYTITPPNVLPTWAHDAGSVFAQSTLKDVAPFTVIDHANIQHSVINYDTHVHTRIKTYHRNLVDRRLERKVSSPILGWQRNPSGYVRTIGPEGLAVSGHPKISTSSTPLAIPKKSRWVIKKDFSETLSTNKAFPTVAQGGSKTASISGIGAGGALGLDTPKGFPFKTWDKDRFSKLHSLPSFNHLWNANPDGTISANYSTEAEDNNPIETGGTNPSFDDPPNTPGISFQQGTKPYHVPNWRFRRLKASFNDGTDDGSVTQYSTSTNSNLNYSNYNSTTDLTEHDYLGGGVENEVSRFLGIKDSARATEISGEGEGNNVQYNKVWMHVGLPSSYRFENTLLKQNSGYSRKKMRGLAHYKSSGNDRKSTWHHQGSHGFNYDHAADKRNSSWGNSWDGWRFGGSKREQHFSTVAGQSGEVDVNHAAWYPHNMADQPKMYNDNGGRMSPIQASYARSTDPHYASVNYGYGTTYWADRAVRRAEDHRPYNGANRGSKGKKIEINGVNNPGAMSAIRRNSEHGTNQPGRYTNADYPYNWVTVSGPYGKLHAFNTNNPGDARHVETALAINQTGDGGYDDGSHFGVRIPYSFKYGLQQDGRVTSKSNYTRKHVLYDKRNHRAGEQVERKQLKDGKRTIAGSTFGSYPWVVLNHEPFSGSHKTFMEDHFGQTSSIHVTNSQVDKLATFHFPVENASSDIQSMYRYLDRYNPEDQRNLYAFLSDYYSAYDVATEEYAVNNYTYKNPYFADARKQKQYRNYTGFRVRSDRYLAVNTKHALSGFKEDWIQGRHEHFDQSSRGWSNWRRGHFHNTFSQRHDGGDYGHRFLSVYNRGRETNFSVQTGKYRHYHPKDVMDFSLKQSIQSKPEFYAPCHIARSDELSEDPYRLTFLNTGSSGPLAQRTTTVGGHEHDLIYANTTFRGDTEFRPINIALVPCIKV